ncbi:MAG: hypothetical protein ACRAVC_20150 [Trichormus sp.]
MLIHTIITSTNALCPMPQAAGEPRQPTRGWSLPPLSMKKLLLIDCQ